MGPTKTLRVLIVDDERVIADTLAKSFLRAGYASQAAYSGEAMVETMSQTSPHLAIIDVVLTGMTGIELAARLQEACPECRIVLLSGNYTTADLLRKAERGGHTWTTLAKPTPPAELLFRAAEILKQRNQ